MVSGSQSGSRWPRIVLFGLPSAEDGEFEFVLLHHKATERIYFYYYFNS